MDILLLLALLVCPLGMGLMMWFMGRKAQGAERSSGHGASSDPPSVAELGPEQSRLSGEIGRLERFDGSRGEIRSR